jgi:hypothetical protein
MKSTANIFVDNYFFSYDDFRDLRGSGSVGNEPLYDFDAFVLQVFFSLWF